MYRTKKVFLVIIVVICVCIPLTALSERFVVSDTELMFDENDALKVVAINSFGDFVLRVNDDSRYHFFRSGVGDTPLAYDTERTIISVALSDDDRIALVLKGQDESDTTLRVFDTEGDTLETYTVEAVSSEDLEVTSFYKVFYRPDNALGVLAISAGESIYDTTYVAIPSLAMPHKQVSAYGFSLEYIGADSDSSLYLNRCLVSGHSVCAMFRLDNEGYSRLPEPNGGRGARLSVVSGSGNYIAQPYPHGPNYLYHKKEEGDYGVSKLAPGKRTRFFRKASHQTVTVADMSSYRTLLSVTSRFRRRRITHPAVGSVNRPNGRRRVRLLSRITDGLAPECKLSKPLKILESGDILTTAICRENGVKLQKVFRLLVLPEKQ